MSKVTPELRRLVLIRDKMCFLYKRDRHHICKDQWGRSHAPTNLNLLTLDHVKDDLMMGVRAPSDPTHLVAMCYAGNVGVPSKEVRQNERDYLHSLYPEVKA
jgi:hypothetical protein